jgi:hypothetical protein
VDKTASLADRGPIWKTSRKIDFPGKTANGTMRGVFLRAGTTTTVVRGICPRALRFFNAALH